MLLSMQVILRLSVFFAVLSTTCSLSSAGVISNWTDECRIPPCTIYQAFKYFLDITTPPSPLLLQQYAPLATSEKQRKRLEVLSKVGKTRKTQISINLLTQLQPCSHDQTHSIAGQSRKTSWKSTMFVFHLQPNLPALLISLMYSAPSPDTSSACG